MSINSGKPRFLQTIAIVAILRDAWRRSQGTISLLIVWICSAVFLGTSLLEILGVTSRQECYSFLGLSYTGLVVQHRIYQIITAPLTHTGLMHLLMNMLILWMFGPEVEQALGRRKYIWYSLVCALASMVGSVAIYWGTSRLFIGYSGVIYGLMVAAAVFFPNHTVLMFWFVPVKMKYVALILSAMSFYFMILPEGQDATAHSAHLLGAVAGFLFLKAPTWAKRRSAFFWRQRHASSVSRNESIQQAARRKMFQDIPKKL